MHWPDHAAARFQAVLRESFRNLWVVTDGIYVVYAKDFDNISVELEMPDIARRLSGILKRDTEIVISWDHPQLSHDMARPPVSDPRPRSWYIPGTETLGTMPVTGQSPEGVRNG